jgi:hypothetical protein
LSSDKASACIFSGGPSVNQVGPFLHHVAALMLVLGLIVDAPRRSSVFMGKTLFNPIAVEAQFVQKGRAGSPKIVNRERLQRQPSFSARSTTAVVIRLNVARDIGASAS